jgi:hypothetical protein
MMAQGEGSRPVVESRSVVALHSSTLGDIVDSKLPVRGCLLAAIMILDYWLQDAYISSICITPMHVPSSGHQHAL